MLWKTYNRIVPSVSRFRFTLIVPKLKEAFKISRLISNISDDNFYLDARAVERIRGCVTIFILVAAYMRITYSSGCVLLHNFVGHITKCY